MSVKCSHIRVGLLGAVAVLIASLMTPAVAAAQVPATAELYGVHEIVVTRPMSSWAPRNPFRDFTLNATYQHIPSGKIVNFWGFYDGNGAGGMQGDIWRIRFMPDLVGTWTVSWAFDDGFSAGTGSFTAIDTGIPGPAKLDPTNIKLLADARNNPIHWRGYGLKHAGAYLDVPITLDKAQRFANEIIDGQLVAGGHNAAYVTVPNGWPDGNCSLASMLGDQLDCPLWGDYNFYSLQAGHFFDIIVKRLHQRRVWAISWITFGIQNSGAAGDAWGRLWANHQPFMRYFVARYGAYYNFFMWSPTWEVFENADYVNRVHQMMSYLHAIDPWKRLQGAQDQAQVAWQDWQRILPRQAPSRTIFDGNSRRIGVFAGPNPFPADYPFVIIGTEDLWSSATAASASRGMRPRSDAVSGEPCSRMCCHSMTSGSTPTSSGPVPCRAVGRAVGWVMGRVKATIEDHSTGGTRRFAIATPRSRC